MIGYRVVKGNIDMVLIKATNDTIYDFVANEINFRWYLKLF